MFNLRLNYRLRCPLEEREQATATLEGESSTTSRTQSEASDQYNRTVDPAGKIPGRDICIDVLISPPEPTVSIELPTRFEAETNTTEHPLPADPSAGYYQNLLLSLSTLFKSTFPFNLSPSQIRSSYALILHCISQPLFLYLPSFYASQATDVARLARNFQVDYDHWTTTQGASESDYIPRYAARDDIELGQCCVADGGSSVDSSTTNYSPSPYPDPSLSADRALSPHQQESMIRLQTAWNRCIDRRNLEWGLIVATASTFTGTSVTFLQIPGVDDNPITPYIAFSALFRAVSAVIYALIFLVSFRTSQARSPHFAMLFFKEVGETEKAALCTPWIMMALPTITFCWTIMLYIFAAFCYIWSISDKPFSPISSYAARALCTIVTTVSVVDIACVLWVLKALSKLRKGVQGKQQVVGESNEYRSDSREM